MSKFNLSEKRFVKNYQFAGKRGLYFEEDVKEFIKELKDFVGNSSFKIDNETLTEFYDEINKLAGDKLI